jgi:hypothetical protein
VELEVKQLSASDPVKRVYAGLGAVMGKKKVSAQFEGELASLDDLEDTAVQRKVFQTLTRE